MRRDYTTSNREKLIGLITLLAIAVVIGVAIGVTVCHGEETLATCYVMCKPGSYVMVHHTPSEKGDVIGYLDSGDSFKTDGTSKNGWIRSCDVGDGPGWVYCGYVVTEKPEKIGERYVCVANKQAVCRRWIGGPQLDGKAGWIKNGQFCQVFLIADGWAVTNRGYIKSEWLEVSIE